MTKATETNQLIANNTNTLSPPPPFSWNLIFLVDFCLFTTQPVQWGNKPSSLNVSALVGARQTSFNQSVLWNFVPLAFIAIALAVVGYTMFMVNHSNIPINELID
jgi:hypothetical protein